MAGVAKARRAAAWAGRVEADTDPMTRATEDEDGRQ